MDTFHPLWLSRCLPPSPGWSGCWASKAVSMVPGFAAAARRFQRASLDVHARRQDPLAVAVLCCWARSAQASALVAHISGPAQAADASSAASTDGWQSWSATRGELTAAGRPVFVDFTAAWCGRPAPGRTSTPRSTATMCKRRSPSAAWPCCAQTGPSATAITAALTALGRSGVPAYVLYAPGKPLRS